MKIKSIRGSFLTWMGFVLSLSLGGFGVSMFGLVRTTTFSEVESDLFGLGEVIAATVARPRPRRPEDQGREPPPDRPPRRPPPPPGGGPGGPHHLPPPVQDRFDSERDDGLFYIIWDSFDSVLDSMNAPASITIPPEARDQPRSVRHEAGRLEVVLRGPEAVLVCVGRSVAREEARLTRLASLLAATGVGILMVGLLGCWWLVGRAIRPIGAMTRAAKLLSPTNLAARIDLTEVHNELGGLAAVLNTTFDRLKEAMDRQARFTADASHELRTPLSIILSETELALSRKRDASELREALESCARSAARMRELVEGMLTLARADAEELRLDRRPVELRDLVDASVRTLLPLARAQEVEIEQACEPSLAVVDAARMSQVISNLLVNAIRYNRRGGHVRVATRRDGDEVILRVADDGIGIAASQRQAIFERFYRADAARAREQGGSGLGLSIVSAIVAAHGGTIACESEPGKGSTFTIRLAAAPSV